MRGYTVITESETGIRVNKKLMEKASDAKALRKAGNQMHHTTLEISEAQRRVEYLVYVPSRV